MKLDPIIYHNYLFCFDFWFNLILFYFIQINFNSKNNYYEYNEIIGGVCVGGEQDERFYKHFCYCGSDDLDFSVTPCDTVTIAMKPHKKQSKI